MSTSAPAMPAVTRYRRPFRPRFVLGRVLVYAILSIGAFLFLMPFFWMLSTSLKPANLVSEVPIVWIPSRLQWENYINPWQYMPFLRWYGNTILVTVLNVMGIVLASSLVAFGFARIPFWGRNVHFIILLATLMLPAQVTLIPTYLLWSKLGAVNTYWPLIVPQWLSTGYDVFLLRQFFQTIPREYDEAALIDGCGWFGIYRLIMMPMSKPALGVLAITNFAWNWNNFFDPLIYLSSTEKFTISLGLTLFRGRLSREIPGLMAMTMISMIPVLITFFLAQRYFIQGIVISGVKG
jgi:multiple sugar transport system permease protein